MRLHPSAFRTFSGLCLAFVLALAACGEPDPSAEPPPASGSSAPTPPPVTGRWEAADGEGVLLLRDDGTFTLRHDLGGAPYEGTYAMTDGGRLRLDVPDLAPMYIERDGDVLAFLAPRGADRVLYERR